MSKWPHFTINSQVWFHNLSFREGVFAYNPTGNGAHVRFLAIGSIWCHHQAEPCRSHRIHLATNCKWHSPICNWESNTTMIRHHSLSAWKSRRRSNRIRKSECERKSSHHCAQVIDIVRRFAKLLSSLIETHFSDQPDSKVRNLIKDQVGRQCVCLNV